MSNMTLSPGRRADLDGLRAVAIGAVLLFHLGLDAVPSGFLGVDVFFVLSGFLITRMIMRQANSGTFSLADFYVSRARRLLPAAFVTIVLTLMVGAVLIGPSHLEATAQSAFFATTSLANIHFWSEAGYFDAASETKPLLHFWSLSVEEQFYMLWPALLLVVFRLKSPTLLSVVLTLMTGLSFAAQFYWQPKYPEEIFFLTPFRVWQLGAGAVLASTGLADMTSTARWPRVAGAVLTMAGLALVIDSFRSSPGTSNVTLAALQASVGAFFIVLAPSNPIATWLLANPLSSWLGRISYSLYLVHWPIIVFALYYSDVKLSHLGMIGAGVLSLAAGWALYKCVEQPFRTPWTTRPNVERFAVPAGLASSALAIVVVTTLIWTQDGWPWRLSPLLANEVIAATVQPRPNCGPRKLDGLVAPQCVHGLKGSDVDIAVIGDSHAGALSAGLSLHLLYNNLTGLDIHRNAGLPLLATVHHFRTGTTVPSMDQHFAAVFSAKPRYVVLHARFANYWEGTGSKAETTSPVFIGPPGQKMEFTRTESQDHFRESLIQTIRVIKRRGGVPVIAGPIPNPGTDIIRCFSRPPLRTVQAALRWCPIYTQAEARARNQPVIEAMRSVANQEGAMFYDPTPLFCLSGQPTCRLTLGDKILYRDDDHLSDYGARMLGQNVLKAILAHKVGT